MGFLGYMLMKQLKDTVDPTEPSTAADATKNEQAFAELIQFLDERSLTLVMRDAKNNGKEALKILRSHYRGKGKQRIICLYTELTSLVKKPSESVIDYIIRAENASTALTEAGETVSDGLLVAMVMKGLPPQFKSFVAVVTQSDKTWSFKDLKTGLRDYEDTEKARAEGSDNSVMRLKYPDGGGGGNRPGAGGGIQEVSCFKCGERGHKANKCSKKGKKWCIPCKASSHNTNQCRKTNKNTVASARANETDEFHSFHFKTDDQDSKNK